MATPLGYFYTCALALVLASRGHTPRLCIIIISMIVCALAVVLVSRGHTPRKIGGSGHSSMGTLFSADLFMW